MGLCARVLVLTAALAGCDAIFGLHSGPVPPTPDAAPLPPSSWSSVAGGTLHTCGIHVDGTLWCWGRNDVGQLGTSTMDLEDDVPTQVPAQAGATWTVIAAGGGHSCGIQSDQTLWCWGQNNSGQVGNGSSASPVYAPSQVVGSWLAVTAGTFHTCGIKTDHSLWCWGDDNFGELGDANVPMAEPAPVAVATNDGRPTQYVQVVAGDNFNCAIGSDQSMWCWGEGVLGELGDGGNSNVSAPVAAGSAGEQWQVLAAGGASACGITTADTLYCWGDGSFGQLGDDMTNGALQPVLVERGSASWIDVALGTGHACGLHTDNTLYCWGTNLTGELAVDTSPELFVSAPVAVTSPADTWLALGLGDDHTCAIDANHELWCAGLDGGELGVAGGGSRTSPVHVGSAAAVFIGGDPNYGTGGTACAIDDSKHLTCWGNNVDGQLGDGTIVNADVATAPSGSAAIDTWTSAGVGDHVCAIDTAQQMYCWGGNSSGAIGIGSQGANILTPTLVPPPSGLGWQTVAANYHNCASDTNANVRCWGFNDSGQDGEVPPTSVLAPTLVPSSPLATILAVGEQHTCAIGSNQTVLCWGDNSFGELGPVGTVSQMPTVVSDLTAGNYNAVAAGGYTTCAGVIGGQFACFGADDHGELGNQTVVSAQANAQTLPGNWLQLSVGQAHTCGITANNMLSCWGGNSFGELGLGSFAEYHEPQPVGSGSDWLSVAAGTDNTCAIKLDHSLYCWGRNLEGEVGDGSAWRSAMMVVH